MEQRHVAQQRPPSQKYRSSSSKAASLESSGSVARYHQQQWPVAENTPASCRRWNPEWKMGMNCELNMHLANLPPAPPNKPFFTPPLFSFSFSKHIIVGLLSRIAYVCPLQYAFHSLTQTSHRVTFRYGCFMSLSYHKIQSYSWHIFIIICMGVIYT